MYQGGGDIGDLLDDDSVSRLLDDDWTQEVHHLDSTSSPSSYSNPIILMDTYPSVGVTNNFATFNRETGALSGSSSQQSSISTLTQQSVDDVGHIDSRKTTSKCWEHFHKIVSERKAKCNYCPWTCSYYDAAIVNGVKMAGSGTKSMLNHMENKAKSIHCPRFSPRLMNTVTASFSNINSGSSTTTTSVSLHQLQLLQMDEGLVAKNAPESYSDSRMRTAINEWIVRDELPFAAANGEGFRNLMQIARPDFTLLDRTTVQRDIKSKMLPAYRAYVKNILLVAIAKGAKFSFTTDIWTCGVQRKAYMSITIHYIDHNFTAINFLLGFAHLTVSHSGEVIASQLDLAFTNWGITSAVMAVVLDNASSCTSAVNDLRTRLISRQVPLPRRGEYLHGRCCAHILNLLAQSALSILRHVVYKLRVLVKHIKTPVKAELFKTFLSHHDDLLDKTDTETKRLVGVALPTLDVVTRWNSTAGMLKSCAPFHVVFEKFFGSVVERVNKDGKAVKSKLPSISKAEFGAMERVERFLSPLVEFTQQLCVTHEPSQHRVVEIVFDLHEEICNAAFNDDIPFLQVEAQLEQEICVASNLILVSDDENNEEATAQVDNLSSSDEVLENTLLLGEAAQLMHEKYQKYFHNLPTTIKIAHMLSADHKLEYLRAYMSNEVTSYSRLLEDIYLQDYAPLVMDLQGNLVSPTSDDAVTVASAANRSSVSSSRAATENRGYESSAKKLRKLNATVSLSSQKDNPRYELDLYLSEPVVIEDGFNVLLWWRANASRFPRLALMARHFLGVPATSVASESAFSTAGRVIDEYRSRLSPSTVEALLLCQSWLRAEVRYGWKLPHDFDYD